MKTARQSIRATTQQFTEIDTVVDDVIFFQGHNACLVIEVNAINFSFLSSEEQDSTIEAFASLLNSLSFPIQILVATKKLDMASYLNRLKNEEINTHNQMLKKQINLYRSFVQELIKVKTVLDKNFYVCLSFSELEEGIVQLSSMVGSKQNKSDFYTKARAALRSKAESIYSQLGRLGLKANTLEKDELIKLFHDIYNPGSSYSNDLAQKQEDDKTQNRKPQSVPDTVAPSSVEVDFHFIRIGESFYRTFFSAGYPRFVSADWLKPLIDFDHSMNISMFIYPTYAADVLSDLRRKIAEMEATAASQMEKGLNVDPKLNATLEDALAIQDELARGVERFFEFSLYITLYSDDLNDLKRGSDKLLTTLNSILILAKTATLQMDDGFKSTIPMASDRLFITRNMDTTSLALAFPFTSAVLTQDHGVMYGVNQQNGSLVVFDRFSLENANQVVLGKAGSGKSYFTKLEAIRQLMFGTEVIIIDPEGEYEKLANAAGGDVFSFTPSASLKMNPFDLSGFYEEGENELGLKILSLQGLLKIIMGQLDPSHDAILDRALMQTYGQKGITVDPATQKREPPLMEDLYKVLIGMEDDNAKELAFRLEKFIKGSLSGIFNQQSQVTITNPLTVFSVKTLEEELRPLVMHIILDFVWTRVKKQLKKRLLIIDEAWYLMRHEDSASFVYSIAKRSRKRYLGLTTTTQDVQDFLSTDYGKAVLSNSSMQVLLKQSPSEIDMMTKLFYLSGGEKQMLLSANIGEGLFSAGQNRVAIKIVAAPFEHNLITTNPQEILGQNQQAVSSLPIKTPPPQSPNP